LFVGAVLLGVHAASPPGGVTKYLSSPDSQP
jgi:hypothetical protein